MNNTQDGSALKVYEQLTYILTTDGELYTTKASPADVSRMVEKTKLLQLGTDYINTAFIKKIFVKQMDEVDNAILEISEKDLRSRVQAEIEKRRKEGSRVNMEVFRNILERLSSN